MENQMTGRLTILREFFESGPDAKKITTAELKALSQDERAELADMITAQKSVAVS